MTLPPKLMSHYSEAFDNIFIHPDSENSPVAQKFRSLFSEKIRPFSELKGQNLKAPHHQQLSSQEFDQSKRDLLIQPFKGKFFKQCPGGNENSACCNYFVLNLGSQCHFNCSYCYLQSFINSPYLVIYSNIDKACEELIAIANSMSKHKIRVGTGEVIDSLGLDPITHYSKVLIENLKKAPNINLELKTKSDFVDHLLHLRHNNQVTVSWSINPDQVIQSEDHGTASLSERIVAAKKCKEAGYTVGFHIDPVIWHEGWEKNYTDLVDLITYTFSPKDIPYLSLGALRFQPEQRHMMKRRFRRDSFVNSAELFSSKDGKLRYDSALRSKMFKHIIEEFKSKDRRWNVFLCMESPETWLSTYGDYPKKVEGLDELFSPKPKVYS